MSFPSYVEPPTRAELAADELPTGTRRLCMYCGCPPADAEVRLCVQVGERKAGEHEFREFPICGYCGGKGGRIKHWAGDAGPDPQTAEECPWCDGSGVEGLL